MAETISEPVLLYYKQRKKTLQISAYETKNQSCLGVYKKVDNIPKECML